jgi:hypothetical protein
VRRLGREPRRTLLAALVALGVAGAAPAPEPVDVLGPELVARLDPARERPLALAPGGDVARLLAEGDWEEGGPPQPLDVDRDGEPDYVAFSLVSGAGDRRAVVIHDWGEPGRDFGPAVFYLIVDAEGQVAEWGGRYRLAARPRPPAPAPPGGGSVPAPGAAPAPPR